MKYHEIRWLQEVVVLLFICLYFRNVYEILTQKEGTNQYEACLMKGKANFHHYFGRNNPPQKKKIKKNKNKRRTVSTDVQSDQAAKGSISQLR